MMPNPHFWRAKRVLLTGHTGFKGSWMALWLQQLGAEVLGYALVPPTPINLFDLARISGEMRSIQGDVRDLARLSAVVEEFQPEIILHMAAQSLVRHSYEFPVETYATNVMGTVNVLEAVRRASGAKVILNITTDKCYENQGLERGYRETDPMGGFDPYSSSKACAELVTAAYRRSFADEGLAIASARAGNVIGGGDWAQDRLIPDIIQAFMEGRPVRIRNPHAIRPWQHVLEPLSGYMALVERLWSDGTAFAEGWNFGPEDDDARPVRWIVERLAERWGDGAAWEFDNGPHYHEAAVLKLDCSKSKTILGWRPRVPLSMALDWTIDWFKAFRDGEDVRTLMKIDIARFETLEV